MEQTKRCSRCTSENDSIRKYCKSCGAPLGSLCTRCGTVNQFEDQFCGSCGMAVVQGSQQTNTPPSMSSLIAPADTRQYSAEDIKELLILRNVMKQDVQGALIMGQHDIDKLFE